MKYAVVRSGGKQYRVSEGETVVVEKLGLKANDLYTFPEVLLVIDEGRRQIGNPTVEGAQVKGSVVGEKKTTKIRVAKFKAKAKYRRVTGSRKVMTHIKIDSITVSNGVKSPKVDKKA